MLHPSSGPECSNVASQSRRWEVFRRQAGHWEIKSVKYLTTSSRGVASEEVKGSANLMARSACQIDFERVIYSSGGKYLRCRCLGEVHAMNRHSAGQIFRYSSQPISVKVYFIPMPHVRHNNVFMVKNLQ